MSLTLVVAGLSSQEKAMLVTVLRAKSEELTDPWTVFWDPSEFPQNPDVLLYCPKRDEGREWFSSLATKGTLPIAAMPPLEASPPEVPLFLRMPFRPQDTADTLNLASKRVRAERPSVEERPQGPLPLVETPIDLQVPFGSANRISSLSLALYAVFREADKTGFYKLRRSDHDGKASFEVWCWPEFGLYWSDADETALFSDFEGVYQIWACPMPKKSLSEKAKEVRHASSLLWRVGTRAIRTAELLPWIHADSPLLLSHWPDLPRDAWTISNIRALVRLTFSEATFGQMLSELQASRKDLCKTLNGLALLGAVAPVPRASREKPAPIALEPEEAIFLKSLALHCSESLDKAVLSIPHGGASA